MPKGKTPKPQALALLNGDKRRKKQQDLKGTDGVPQCPEHLDEYATEKWHEVVKLLADMKVLTLQDSDAIEKYCVNYSLYRQSADHIAKGDTIQVNPRTGHESPSAHVKNFQQAQAAMDKFLLECGFTPASRARLRMDKPTEEPDDDFDAKFGG